MQFKAAAFDILKNAVEPLHYNEITDRALDQQILTTAGQTPHATMGSWLYTDTLREDSRFRQEQRSKSNPPGMKEKPVRRPRRKNPHRRRSPQKSRIMAFTSAVGAVRWCWVLTRRTTFNCCMVGRSRDL
jgi:hypothetical protein